MTQNERLKLCSTCTNKGWKASTGLFCKLTGEPPAFEHECPHFVLNEENSTPVVESPAVSLEAERRASEALQRMVGEQNLPMGLVAALGAGILGAILWGMITVATGYQIGYMALGIGAGVGFANRLLGKGLDPIHGYLGGAVAFFSCLLGNYFSVIGFVANAEGLGYLETMGLLDFDVVVELMGETFSIMDILFYGLATYEGYKFSFRNVSEADLR